MRDESQINFPPQVGRSSLQLAAAGGHLEIVKLLLNAGAAVDHQDELDRNTALHLASEHGYSQALSLLCSSRANVYMKNRAGFGALHVACQNGHNQSCRELLTSGCRPDIKNNVRLGHRRRTLVTCVDYFSSGTLRYTPPPGTDTQASPGSSSAPSVKSPSRTRTETRRSTSRQPWARGSLPGSWCRRE